MDKRVQRKPRHIREKLDPDNATLILNYFDAMKFETCGKVVQDKHL